MSPIKGLETLIRAAARLRSLERPVHLVVLGPVFASQKAYHATLTRLVTELGVANLSFVGARSDVRALLKRFDIYVCSSLAESSPVSVWEAMAMARPVVSTDVGDVPRHVEDGKAGYIVGVGDHEAMAERLALLCADPDMRRRQGETARRIALTEFTPDVIGRETLEFYRLIRHDTA